MLSLGHVTRVELPETRRRSYVRSQVRQDEKSVLTASFVTRIVAVVISVATPVPRNATTVVALKLLRAARRVL